MAAGAKAIKALMHMTDSERGRSLDPAVLAAVIRAIDDMVGGFASGRVSAENRITGSLDVRGIYPSGASRHHDGAIRVVIERSDGDSDEELI